jgi:hypothetical protein
LKVCLGLIYSHGFPVPAPFVSGLTGVLYMLLTGSGNRLLPVDRQITAARVLESYAFPVDAARNELCRMFLDQDDAEYLLFLDADMRHQPEIAHRLVSHGQPLVTGRYQMRKSPFWTVAMRKTGDGPRDYKAVDKVTDVAGLIPVDAAGAGALLIHRSVLVAIRERIGDEWFKYQVGASGLRDISEDMWFFEQSKAAGFQAYLDADATCTHVGQFEIDAAWAPSAERIKQAIAQEEAAVSA